MEKENNSIVHATGSDWINFVKYGLLGLGTGFLLSGIIFFFAYNWDDIHRFAKFGTVGAAMVGCLVGVFYTKNNKLVQNCLITAMSVLAGVMIALYGQVYQLEADSYMMFLVWGLVIIVWCLVADFYPLWLIETVLCSVWSLYFP